MNSLIGLLLSKGGHGFFDVCNDLGACCAHEGEACTDGRMQSTGCYSKEELTPLSASVPH